MTNADLKAWQAQMGCTYETAAAALGVSRATYARYIKDGPPKIVGLACAAIAAGLSEYSSEKK